MVNTDEYVVTPWEVKGNVNYDKLIQEFGTYPIRKTKSSKERQVNRARLKEFKYNSWYIR